MLILKLYKDESVEFQNTETGEKIGNIVIGDKSNLEYVYLGFDFPKSITMVRSDAIKKNKI